MTKIGWLWKAGIALAAALIFGLPTWFLYRDYGPVALLYPVFSLIALGCIYLFEMAFAKLWEWFSKR